MMTRQEFEAQERELNNKWGSTLYDRLLCRCPINAWSDDELKRCHDELKSARTNLTANFDLLHNADMLKHVSSEIGRRQPYK